jgi:hypothetical protein
VSAELVRQQTALVGLPIGEPAQLESGDGDGE